MSSPLPSDTKLGRYVIRSLIGTGGMGEVYLADDTLLRRPTAIKLLTGDFTQKEERLHRFEREAYAASSLNHPNIVTIYEIGSDNGHHFIATEYVDGQSLRHHARISPLDFREIVEIAIQVASALTAAHEAGIIHRDIKPENIMLRRDGYVKVLDFGLAKLTDESWHHDADAEAATQMMIKTEPGRVMGTIDYMSPEQARGREVDPRSDIFSLGVVIYELATGVKPFSGDTKSDVLAAVLTADAVPVLQRKADAPPELNRIVNKCLRKDREERYQTTKELLVDLKSLRQELEFASKLGLTFSTTRSEAVETAVAKATDSISGKTSAPTVGIPPTTVSELFINEVKIHPRRSFVLISILGAVVLAAGFGLYKLWKRTGPNDSFQNMRMTKLTTGGDVSLLTIAVSPDGKYVAYPIVDAGSQSLWIRHVATSSNVQIVAPQDAEFTGLTFSPDGSYLYYTIEEKRQSSTLYQVPVLGGTARRLIDNAKGPVTFSPDGSRLAFRRDASQLVLANTDGSDVRILSTRSPNEIWLPPAWSPNKQLLVAGLLSLTEQKSRLVEISLDDGKEKFLASEPWLSLSSLVWLSDGSGLVLTGRDLDTKLYQIWFVGYPDGKRRRVTNDLSSYAGVSLTADGKTLVSVQNQRVTNLWVAPNGNSDLATKVTFETGKDEGLSGLSWTPDGRIVHTEKNSGATDLWVINSDGSNNTQLTMNAGRNFYPNVTPDGRFIVFISDRAGRNDIWRVDLDGRNPFQITNFAPVNANPSVSADGKWVLYITSGDDNPTIWKSSIDGGPPVPLTRSAASRPAVSTRGDKFVCKLGEAGKSEPEPLKLALFSLAGGEPERLLNLPNVLREGQIQWDATGEALIFRESKNRVDNLWSQTLNGGTPKQLTDFKSDQIFVFDWSRDGKNVVLARGRSGSDVVMITSFR